MSKIGKKEKKIMLQMARKKLDSVKDIQALAEAKQRIAIIPTGRPKLYETPQELETLIAEYFIKQEADKQPPTVTGLALKLWIDRKTLLDYSKQDLFSPVIKEAKQKIMNYAESLLLQKDKFTLGQIFYLKNNYKESYREKIEVEGNINSTISLVQLHARAEALQGEVLDWEEVQAGEE